MMDVSCFGTCTCVGRDCCVVLYHSFLISRADIDECLSNPCPQVCDNSPGSYSCRCREGFSLDQTTNKCKGKPATISIAVRMYLFFVSRQTTQSYNYTGTTLQSESAQFQKYKIGCLQLFATKRNTFYVVSCCHYCTFHQHYCFLL
jgi:hypothetical protein